MESTLTPELLKKRRIEKGFSQQEVADHIGVSQASYQYYETGERNPKHDKILKLIDLLDINGARVPEETTRKLIPVYSAEFSCGFSDLVKDKNYIIGYVEWVPQFKGCEIVVEAKNDSMLGVISPGDWVGMKRIYDFSEINYGGIYGVVTKNHNLFKYIRKGKSDEYITVVSENKQYDDRQIAVSKLIELWIVMRVVPLSQVKFLM